MGYRVASELLKLCAEYETHTLNTIKGTGKCIVKIPYSFSIKNGKNKNYAFENCKIVTNAGVTLEAI